jgi:hypothetical protein
LWLHSEELLEQNLVGLDSHKCLAEVYKDRDMENTIGIQIQALDAVVLRRPLKKALVGSASPRSAKWENIGISSGFVSIGYGSLVEVHHKSISFSWRNPLLTRESRSSVFNLAFFHSLAGLGYGVDSGDDSGADPSASLRALFFPAPVFKILDGDAFILQVQGVFTRICSGATLAVDCGGAYRSNPKRGGGGEGAERQ